jgi:hypothetical protein
MRLENAIQAPMAVARGTLTANGRRLFKHMGRAGLAWVAVVPGTPARGERIIVLSKDGYRHVRWVQQVLASAADRHDGQSVCAVSKVPVPQGGLEQPVESAPPPRAPPALKQRNPRVCEECEGPCRPGSGTCDDCRRGSRVAEDGVILRPGPEPGDVF